MSVIVAAYDEEAGIEPTVREIVEALRALARPYEVVIVDDGSRDATPAKADALAAAIEGVRVVHHAPNQGLGGVYRTGFATARGELVTFFPADGQFPASIIPRFVEAAAACDLVLGYVTNLERGLVGRLLSRCERLLYRLLFGSFPRFQGIVMVRRELLERFALRSSGRGWAVLMELILRATRSGCRVASAPSEMRPRLAGHSKVQNLRTIWSNLKQAWTLRRILREQPSAEESVRV